jgi:hypothetical protein
MALKGKVAVHASQTGLSGMQIQPQFIIGLVERFNNKKWEKFNSEKVCHISYARIQVRQQNPCSC